MSHIASAATFALGGLLLLGCNGSIDGSLGNGGGTPPEPGASNGPGPGPTPDANIDPGRVGIHRLNNTEYNNTVRDLLGTASKPAAKFLAEDGNHFDNNAASLTMNPAQYEKYFGAAGDLMVEALANPANAARFLTCVPAATAEPCARQIIDTFGLQIHRRPLDAAEVDRAMDVYNADLARGSSGTEAIAQALRAMLASASFLYRIEFDANPTSLVPHALSGYELASRLSYLQWSTIVESFAGQWLDIRKLLTHSVEADVFPTFTLPLADAVIAEGQLWFQDFLNQDRPMSEWFTADFNYVNDTLAQHYGFPPPGTGDTLTRVTVTTDQRRGFLGLASFLTRTSVPSRTSPTERGAWVLSELLCDAPPLPPPGIPELEASAKPGDMSALGAENVRDRLERHRSDPACNSCHQLFDPIGLGLERYDGIGRYREAYGNGDAIQPQGVMPDGTPFAGPDELGAILGRDPRFNACIASQMFTYALGREVEGLDAATMTKLQARWASRGPTLKNLMKEVVLTDAFRFRRGEAE